MGWRMGMAHETAGETLSGLLDDLYETVVDQGCWQSFLVRVAEAVSAKSALLRIEDAAAAHVSYAVYHGLDPGLQEAYRDYYIRIDPLLAKLKTLPPGIIYPGHDYYRQQDLARTEYFQDYMRPQNNYFVAGGFIQRDDRCAIQFALQRERVTGPFGEEDMALLQTLVPHLKRAVNLQRLLGSQSRRLSAAESALERMSIGVLLLNDRGGLEFANRQAEGMLQGGYGIRFARHRLHALDTRESDQLQRLIDAACGHTAPGAPPAVGSLLLSGTGRGERDLFAVVFPLGRDSRQFQLLCPRAAVVVYIGSAHNRPALSRTLLESLFGLTPAESRLAIELVKGLELKQIAERLHVTTNTLKTQLRAIFRKTGTQRQQDLLRILSAEHWALGGAP